MSRSYTFLLHSLTVLAASFLVTLLSAGTLHATIVGAQTYGNELAGGEITVTYGLGATHSETIQDGGGQLGFVNAPGFFDFSVNGDTFLADWQLTNRNSADFILSVQIDLSPIDILFDDDSSAVDTMNGYAGREGAVQVNLGIPTITGSDEFNFWADPMNMDGDEWHSQLIQYGAQDFRNGQTSIWRDDTDIIGVDRGPELPEPTAAVLLVIGGIALAGHRRR